MSTASWVKQATSASGTVIDVPLDISFSPKYVDFSAANIYPGQGFIYTIESGPTKEIGFGRLKTGTPWVLVREQVVEVCVNGRIERRDSKLSRINMKPGSIITLGNAAYAPPADVPRINSYGKEKPSYSMANNAVDVWLSPNTWIGTVFAFETTTAVPLPLNGPILTNNDAALAAEVTACTGAFYIINPSTGYAEMVWDETDFHAQMSGGTSPVFFDIDPPSADGDSIIFYPGYYVFAVGMSTTGTTSLRFDYYERYSQPAWLGGDITTAQLRYEGSYNSTDKLPAVLDTISGNYTNWFEF